MEGYLHFLVAYVILLALASPLVTCYDPSPLQDYCVAVNDTNGVFVNGRFCKDPRLVTADDFFDSGLNIPGNTSNRLGVKLTTVEIDTVLGLNTLGVAFLRIDFAPGGQVPPHIHPRSTELMVVHQGTLYVGFVSSNQDNNRLFTKILYPGDAFVFPMGMIHFHVNIGNTNAVAFSAGGSQNPGYISVGDSVFGSDPRIDGNALAKAFALDMNTVSRLQREFPFENILG